MLVQMWLGKMNDTILDCLEHNRILYGEDNYCLISDINLLNSKNFINVETYKDDIYEKLKTPTEISNYVRLRVLIDNPTWIYADADVKFNQDITNLFTDKMYYGKYDITIDTYIMKPNGDNKELEFILNKYKKMNFFGRGCLFKLVRGGKNIIPDTYYTHLEYSKNKK